MIDGLKPYPVMKDSGVPWLGKVPEHWEMKPIKHWLKINAEVLPETTDPEFSFKYVDIGSVGTGYLTQPPSTIRLKDAPSRARRIVQSGDTIVSLVRTYLKAVLFFPEADNVICSTGFVVLSPKQETIAKYVSYLAQSNPFTDRVSSESVGVAYPAIAEGKLAGFRVAAPPTAEQAGIVRFLDHADARIRRYIAAKQKVIKLLEEEKHAIIHGAVTRGVDPNVRLKPSGVEWLGDIPEHWNIVRSRRLFSVRTELARPDDIQLSATQAYGVIAQSEFERKVGRRVVKISMHLEKRRHVEKDDFVISMRSFQGGLERAWVSGCIRSSYVVLKPSADVDVGLFTYLFKSHGYIRALQATASFIRDGQDLNFKNFRLVDLPAIPLEEQRHIAEFLNKAIENIETAIYQGRKEIELLREFRTRLIADLVTGKLDVREAAAKLPEIAPEAEPPDETDNLQQYEESAEAAELEAEDAA